MALPADLAKQEQKRFMEAIARLRATPEERARILSAGVPFDYAAWLREAGTDVPEELAEMEALLREREKERLRSLNGEVDSRGIGGWLPHPGWARSGGRLTSARSPFTPHRAGG